MKTKNPEELAEMIQPLLKNNTPPYAEDMSELAEKLMGHVRSSLANNDMDLIEAAGRTALGVMLEQYASGDLEKRDAIAFLRKTFHDLVCDVHNNSIWLSPREKKV